jgi:REP element-mobilizing transposase RayT
MPSSFANILLHFVFATKDRRPELTPEIRDKVLEYIGGSARGIGANVIAVGGVEDHVHLFVNMPRDESASVLMQKVKANTTKWLRESLGIAFGGWQEGYGVFSVSHTHRDRVEAYVRGQRRITARQRFRRSCCGSSSATASR